MATPVVSRLQFSKLMRPPVHIYGIKGHYATALYSAASKQNKLEQVEKELRVAQIWKEPKMATSTMTSYVKCSMKVKSLNDVTAKVKFSPVISNLVSLLVENCHLNNTPGVIFAFSTMMSAHHGEVLCSVTTTSPLDEVTFTQLKTVLKSFLSKGQVLKLEVKKYADMSLKTKIQELSRAMQEVF
ncbi:unnamed protein product [Nyctereutes procyonoides]|uniref:ATP synthase peripheral stalk subunit OSCP, mitochondrial n=1 Tax=Nyctereutes procyonoides TaxID=34880 RepID=A0A811ZWZ4_NYCPR|nr:unnamed protein product [Nyctereutes procyonoides]